MIGIRIYSNIIHFSCHHPTISFHFGIQCKEYEDFNVLVSNKNYLQVLHFKVLLFNQFSSNLKCRINNVKPSQMIRNNHGRKPNGSTQCNLPLTAGEAEHWMVASIEQCHPVLRHHRLDQIPGRRRVCPTRAQCAWHLRPLAATLNVAGACGFLGNHVHVRGLEELAFAELGQHQWTCPTAEVVGSGLLLNAICRLC